MKPLSAENLAARLLGKLAWAVIHRRQWFFWPQIILFGLSILYTVKFLEFRTNRNDLVGSGKKYHQNFLAFKNEFPTQDDLVVVVESENAEKNRQFVERIGAKLEAETNLFMHVFYKGDLKMLGSKALLFVPEPDLLELRKKLNDYLPFVEPFTHTTNLVSLFDMINTQFRTAKRERNEQTESLIRAIPALERIVTQATASLRRGGSPPVTGRVCSVRRRPGGGTERLHHVCPGADLSRHGAGAEGRTKQRRRVAAAPVGRGNPGGGAGNQRRDHRRTGVGPRRNEAVAKRHHGGERRLAHHLRADFHLRLQRDRAAAQGHALSGGGAGLHDGLYHRWWSGI